jgi:hypothetical protein
MPLVSVLLLLPLQLYAIVVVATIVTVVVVAAVALASQCHSLLLHWCCNITRVLLAFEGLDKKMEITCLPSPSLLSQSSSLSLMLLPSSLL